MDVGPTRPTPRDEEGDTMKKKPIQLKEIGIASPCGEDLDAMSGTHGCRFCEKCQHEVINLSAMTRSAAEAFLERNAENDDLCVMVEHHGSGEVLFMPEPERRREEREYARWLKAAAVAIPLLAACNNTKPSTKTPKPTQTITPVEQVSARDTTDEPAAPPEQHEKAQPGTASLPTSSGEVAEAEEAEEHVGADCDGLNNLSPTDVARQGGAKSPDAPQKAIRRTAGKRVPRD